MLTSDGRGYDDIRIGSADADFYSIDMALGASLTAAATSLSSGQVDIALIDPTGTVVAVGGDRSADNVDQLIGDYLAPSSGTYVIRVTGDLGTDYSLVVTRNAAFDTGNNDSIEAAQPFEVVPGWLPTQWVHGAIGGISSDNGDFYQLTVADGKPITIETTLPAARAGEFVNGLDPMVRLYDAAGNLLASDDNGAADGTQRLRLRYRPQAGNGTTYYVQVVPSGAPAYDPMAPYRAPTAVLCK